MEASCPSNPLTAAASRRDRRARSWTLVARAAAAILLALVCGSGLLHAAPTTRPARTGPEGTDPATRPDVDLEELEAREMAVQLDILRLDKLDLSLRQRAARNLLDRARPAAVEALAKELDPRGNPTTQRAIVQALVELPDVPPSVFVQPLLDLLAREDDQILSEVATALGRYPDPKLFQRLVALTGDPQAPANQRRGAILTLSYHRTRTSAETLMRLIQPDQPPWVRDAAFTALAQLTGIADFNHDHPQWEKWWNEAKKMPVPVFNSRLFDNFARTRSQLAAQVAQAHGRIVELQRQVYRATPQAERPVVLVAMLNDPIAPVRQAGMELTLQWLTDRGTIGPELRDAIRGRLDEANPAMRQRAALLLRDLGDEKAADIVAGRLARREEQKPELLKVYLLLVSRLPRAQAASAILELLPDPVLGVEAAGALVAALDAKLLDPAAAQPAVAKARPQIKDDPPPDPRWIDLLQRAGADDDWKRIHAWLDHPSPPVREAAAKAWANSSRKLQDLAERAGDAMILRILLDAAQKRGDEASVLLAIIDHKPGDEQGVQAWRKTILAMAGRVAPTVVPGAERKLAGRGEPSELRLRMLTAAIEAQWPGSVPPAATNTANGGGAGPVRDPAGLIDLLLARAELRLADSDAQSALADLQRLLNLHLTATTTQQQRLDLDLLRVKLALNDLEGLADLVNKVLGAGGAAHGNAALTRQLAEGVLLAAARGAAAGQVERARPIAAALRALPEGAFPAALAPRLAELEAQVGTPAGSGTTTQPAATAPAPPPVPALLPSTRPAGAAAVAPPPPPAPKPPQTQPAR